MPEKSDGMLVQLTLQIPDEETVAEIAQQYDLDCIYRSDSDTYYYEFPVTWADSNTIVKTSIDAETGEVIEAESNVFAYLYADGNDVFSDAVTL